MSEMTPTDLSVAGQRVIITGGAAGLGESYVRHLANGGASVLVCDVNGSRADELAQDLRDEGRSVLALHGSVADPDTATRAVRTALDEFGGLEVLINNAGAGSAGPFLTLGPSDMRFLIDVHLFGTLWMAQAAIAHMADVGYGRIVNTTSRAGTFGVPGAATYCAAKAGIMGLTRSLALEFAGRGIMVNAIAPTAFTEMGAQYFSANPHLDRTAFSPDAVAPVVAYLCTPACAITGEVLQTAAGRVYRIGVSASPGYRDPALTVDGVAANLSTILSDDGLFLPTSAADPRLAFD